MKKKIIICIILTMMSAVVSAQSYIQVDRVYSGSGVDKTLTLTIRNLSDKEMLIRNKTEICPTCSNITYRYLSNNGTVLYWSWTSPKSDFQYHILIPAQSSKSYTFNIGTAARYPISNVNRNDIRTIQLQVWISYGILGLNYRGIFDETDSVPF